MGVGEGLHATQAEKSVGEGRERTGCVTSVGGACTAQACREEGVGWARGEEENVRRGAHSEGPAR